MPRGIGRGDLELRGTDGEEERYCVRMGQRCLRQPGQGEEDGGLGWVGWGVELRLGE